MISRVCLETYSSHHICDSSEICLLVVELEIFFPPFSCKAFKDEGEAEEEESV